MCRTCADSSTHFTIREWAKEHYDSVRWKALPQGPQKLGSGIDRAYRFSQPSPTASLPCYLLEVAVKRITFTLEKVSIFFKALDTAAYMQHLHHFKRSWELQSLLYLKYPVQGGFKAPLCSQCHPTLPMSMTGPSCEASTRVSL